MNLPDEFNNIFVLISIVIVLWIFANYFTKSGRNFRSRRNKKARKQF